MVPRGLEVAAFVWWLGASAAPQGTDASVHTEATDVMGSLFACFLASIFKQLDHIIRGHARSANSKQTLQYHLKRSRKIKQFM